MAQCKVASEEQFLLSLSAHHKSLTKPLSEKHLSRYFQGDVLKTATEEGKQLKKDILKQLKEKVETEQVLKCKILEMIADKLKLLEQYRQQGPTWRFTGVPDEDVGAVQWMVSQERLAAKSKQQEKVNQLVDDLLAEVAKREERLVELRSMVEEEYQSLTATHRDGQEHERSPEF